MFFEQARQQAQEAYDKDPTDASVGAAVQTLEQFLYDVAVSAC